MNLDTTEKVKDIQARLLRFMDEHIYPNEAAFDAEVAQAHWQPSQVMEELKAKAREQGLWNLFIPRGNEMDGGTPEGQGALTHLEYATLCETMGRSHIAPEACNCSAPDTGNMEVLARYGTDEHKQRWLKPLLAGEIRSCFAMTEPEVASSDATNIRAQVCREGEEYVINGRKWWSSGAGDPRCKVAIFMGQKQPHRGCASAAIDGRGADGCAGRAGGTHADRVRLRPCAPWPW